MRSVPSHRRLALRGFLALTVFSSSSFAALTLSSSHALKGFENNEILTSSLAEAARSGHHHHEGECGTKPKVYRKYEYQRCLTCFHHVMYVKGVDRNDDGEEEATDLGTIANYWLHNGKPATHFYDREGTLIALLWSTVLSTPHDVKEVVIVADCHDNSLWEVKGSGYTKELGWGILHLENNTKIDFSSDHWGDEDDVVEEGSGKRIISMSNGWGTVEALLTRHGKEVLPEAADDARIFVLLMGTSILRVTAASPWNFTTVVIIPLILLCCCGLACYMGFRHTERSSYESVPDSKQMD